MTYVAIAAAIVFLVVARVAFGRMNVRRDPARETEGGVKLAVAYRRTCGWVPFNVLRGRLVRRVRRLAPSGLLLDAGCGPGQLSAGVARAVPGLKVIGLDIDPDMVALARRDKLKSGLAIEYCVGDVHRLPFPDGSIDFVLTSLSMHHWSEPGVALKEFRRVLRPGGQFMVYDIIRDCPRWCYWGIVIGQAVFAPRVLKETGGAVGSFYASYTRAEIKTMMETAGLGCRLRSEAAWVYVWGKQPG
jgi:ubiquinone/menaquinone biosynthesis C-methylase UbiE